MEESTQPWNVDALEGLFCWAEDRRAICIISHWMASNQCGCVQSRRYSP